MNGGGKRGDIQRNGNKHVMNCFLVPDTELAGGAKKTYRGLKVLPKPS